MEQPLVAAVVGSGGAAAGHILAWRHAGVAVAAGSGPSPEAVGALARRLG
jgi:predicted dehydrogenase